MARRNDHSREEIRQLALDAAESMVISGGHQALSARKIATQIGYTVGTLYLVFSNLNDLVLHLNGRTLDQMLHWLKKADSNQQGEQATLKGLAYAYIEYVEQNTHRWNLLEEFVTKNHEVPDWYQQKLAQLFSLVEDALRNEGGLHDDTRILQAARVLWASVHGICLLKIRQRLDLAGGLTSQQMADMLIENFMRGMKEKGNYSA